MLFFRRYIHTISHKCKTKNTTGAVLSAGDNETLLAAATAALANMAISKEFCKTIDEKGGAQAVLKKLKEVCFFSLPTVKRPLCLQYDSNL